MANNKVRILANLAVHGTQELAVNLQSLPLDGQPGQWARVNNMIYAYVDLAGVATWYPITQKTRVYVLDQDTASDDWYVPHNMNTADYWYQIQDEDGNIMSVAISEVDTVSFHVKLAVPMKGKVLVVAADAIDVPQVTANIASIANGKVVINNQGVSIDGVLLPTTEEIQDLVAAGGAAGTSPAQLATAIAAEATSRDTAIGTAVSAESTARDTAISTAVSAEATARGTAITSAVAAEATARGTAISAEATARDTAIGTAVAAEATARNAAIAAAVPAVTAVPYDVACSIQGKPAASAVVMRFIAVRAFKLPLGYTDSLARSVTAATAATVFNIFEGATNIGTLTFAAGQTTGTFSAAAARTVAKGSLVTIVAPAVVDATFADAAITLAATL